MKRHCSECGEIRITTKTSAAILICNKCRAIRRAGGNPVIDKRQRKFHFSGDTTEQYPQYRRPTIDRRVGPMMHQLLSTLPIKKCDICCHEFHSSGDILCEICRAGVQQGIITHSVWTVDYQEGQPVGQFVGEIDAKL